MNLKSRQFRRSGKQFPEDKTAGVLAILRIIDKCERFNAKTYAEKFDIHERNIYRDIEDLESVGFAIIFDEEKKTYRFKDPDFFS